MNDNNDNNQTPSTNVQLHLFGDLAEVEAIAAMLRQGLPVVEESATFQDPDAQDDPTRVRRQLAIEFPAMSDRSSVRG